LAKRRSLAKKIAANSLALAQLGTRPNKFTLQQQEDCFKRSHPIAMG